MPNFETGLRHVLPWFLPGTALAAVLGLVAGRRLGRALGTSYKVAWFLVVGFGMVIAATLTPLRGAFNPDATGGTCDLSRIGLAPLGELLRFGDISLNVALFIPLGAALGLLPRYKGKVILVAGAIALPFVIETTQLLVPALERGCQSADVFDNLTGLLIGLLIGTGVGRLMLMALDETPPATPESNGRGSEMTDLGAVRLRAARAVKRAMDVAGASVALVLFSPVLAWTALAVLLTQGRPILFRQERPGLGGRPFTMMKFRTMRVPRHDEVYYLTDDVRITRLGRFLRSTSLDELPELWNVIRGDMSLVGPRPLLMEYLEEYSSTERRRHDVRPGITGWAVVNGRNTLQFGDRLSLDVWYVDHWSLALDVRILVMTISQVLRRQGVSATEDLTLGFRLPGLDPGARPDLPGEDAPAPASDEPDRLG